MKKYLLLIFLAFIFTHQAKAITKINGGSIFKHSKSRSVYLDTLTILQDNIIAHKETFQHQELNVLLKQLHLKVKSYMPIRGQKPGGPIKGIMVYFEDWKTVSDKISNLIYMPSIFISFDNAITLIQTYELRTKSQGEWQQAEIDFYGKQLVNDIQVSKKR
jgi:hypothetical protein